MSASRGSERLLQEYLKRGPLSIPPEQYPNRHTQQEHLPSGCRGPEGTNPHPPKCVLLSQSPPLLSKLMSHDSSNVFLWLQNHFA